MLRNVSALQIIKNKKNEKNTVANAFIIIWKVTRTTGNIVKNGDS